MQETLAYQDDGFDITISVENPQIKGDTMKYVVYTIKGTDKKGDFSVIRRFSDFDKVREIIVLRWPGCYVPSLPEKKAIGNMDAPFVEQRRLGLSVFLESLSKINHLWYSDEVQILIKNPSQEIEKQIAPFAKISNAEMILRYVQTFPQVREKVIGPDSVSKVNLFGQYLKKIQPVLENLIDLTKNNLANRKKYNEQTEALISYLLPEYEKNCLKEYLPDANQDVFVFYGNKDQVIEEQSANIKGINSKTDIDLVYQGLRYEKREIEAFTEAIKVKDDYHNQFLKSKQKLRELEQEKTKINAGKTTFSSFMKTKSKEQILKQLQIDIQAAEKEQNNLSAISDISVGLLTLIEVDKFKKNRLQNYYDLVKRSAEFELNISKAETDLWKAILKSDAMSKADPS